MSPTSQEPGGGGVPPQSPTDAAQQADSVAHRDYYQSWFATIAAQTGGFARGVLARVEDDEVAVELSRWPLGSDAPLDVRARRLAREASLDRAGRFEPFAGADGDAWLLAYPVLLGRQVVAVVLLELTSAQQAQLQRTMNALQWGSAWIGLRLLQDREGARGGDRSPLALALLARVLEPDGATLAGTTLVQELARLTSAERVSLGLGHPDALKITAISDVTEFDPRMNEVRQLEAAMREAIAEGGAIVCGAPASFAARPAHEALHRLGAGGRIETHPLFALGEPVGAVVVEYRATDPDGQAQAATLPSLLALAARALQLQVDAKASVGRRTARFWQRRVEALTGPGGYRAKTVAAVAAVLAVFFAFVEGEYRLTAQAQIEPAFQRVVTAPWNGYLAQASARPGDEVAKGQALLRLDDREQHLERTRWAAEVEKLRKKTNQAIATHDRPALSVLAAQLRQAEAQLDLVESQLARVEIAAPFDGLIVSGDPAQRLGDVLKKGEVVYQIAPLHAYRVIVRVPESRAADLARGMKGTMQLSSIPDLTLRLTVERIHPFTQRRDAESFFVVEAAIDGDVARVRPGMEGVAAIDVDRRGLLGIWTRGLVDWLRLKWWSLPG